MTPLFPHLLQLITLDLWEYHFQAFNRKEALTLGKIIPKRGVDEAYDQVKEEKAQVTSA